MNYTEYVSFLGNNFMFSFTFIIVAFVQGWLLYNHIILKGICLKDALFEKDNLAAWIEFIGAFIFPTLYLAAKAIEGSVDQNIFVDLGISVAYVVAYVLVFTVLRLLSGVFVRYMAEGDKQGKIRLNNEIYNQNNIAAALFSVSLSTVFVSMIQFLDVLPEFFLTSVLRMANVLLFTLIALIVYCFVLKSKTTLFKEIFIDDNIAAGTTLLGFIFAVEVILTNAVSLQKEFDFAELLAFSLISLLLFGILSALFKWIFTSIIKVDFWKEVYEQNNIGAAIGQIALYIGIANVIVHFLT